MITNKVCKKCNKEMIDVYHTKKYCEECALMLNKESMKKSELKREDREEYKKKYWEENREQKLENYHKEHHKELICPGCNDLFTQRTTNQKYCTTECMKNNHRLRNKKRYAQLSKIRYEKYKEENPNYIKEQHIEHVKKENKRRSKLGVPLVGQNFRRETEMFVYINYLFPEQEIIFHDRRELDGLELDVFIPTLKLAFEYMGRQHFEEYAKNSIYISSQEEFDAQKFRDERKIELCKEKGITLIHINYYERLSEQLILQKLNERNINCIQKIISGQNK